MVNFSVCNLHHHNDLLPCTGLALFSHSVDSYTAVIPDISQDCCMQLFLMLSKFQTVDARVLDDYYNSNFKSVQCYSCLLDFTFCNSLANTG